VTKDLIGDLYPSKPEKARPLAPLADAIGHLVDRLAARMWVGDAKLERVRNIMATAVEAEEAWREKEAAEREARPSISARIREAKAAREETVATPETGPGTGASSPATEDDDAHEAAAEFLGVRPGDARADVLAEAVADADEEEPETETLSPEDQEKLRRFDAFLAGMTPERKIALVDKLFAKAEK